MAFGESATVGPDDEGRVEVCGLGGGGAEQGAVEEQLTARGGDEVIAPHDVGDAGVLVLVGTGLGIEAAGGVGAALLIGAVTIRLGNPIRRGMARALDGDGDGNGVGGVS